MKLFKAIDLYGKIPKGLAEPTSSGAVVSIVTLLLLALLLVTEFTEYITIDVLSDIVVDEMRTKDRVQINFDIKFVRAPCDFLELESYDAMGQTLSNDNKKIQLIRLDSSENEIGVFKKEENGVNIEEARKAVGEKQGCIMRGSVKVTKVHGKIQFGPHKSHQYIGAVGTLNFPLDYSHKIVSLSFGDQVQLGKVKSKFNQGQLETLSGNERIKRYELATVSMQHEHYVNVVPTTFTLLNKQQYHVYQYTANHNEVRAQYYPQMIIRYEFSPVTVNFWQTKEDILHFIVQICAIIGGIFTVSSMVESSVYKIMRILLKVE